MHVRHRRDTIAHRRDPRRGHVQHVLERTRGVLRDGDVAIHDARHDTSLKRDRHAAREIAHEVRRGDDRRHTGPRRREQPRAARQWPVEMRVEDVGPHLPHQAPEPGDEARTSQPPRNRNDTSLDLGIACAFHERPQSWRVGVKEYGEPPRSIESRHERQHCPLGTGELGRVDVVDDGPRHADRSAANRASCSPARSRAPRWRSSSRTPVQ